MPAAAQLAPRPAASRSTSVTAQPACASRQPIDSPIAPAPTMATRHVDKGGVVVSRLASLRRHYPWQVQWV
jgi:hypothetical protein